MYYSTLSTCNDDRFTNFFLDPGLHRCILAREELSSLEVAGIICIDSSLLAFIIKVIMMLMVTVMVVVIG